LFPMVAASRFYFLCRGANELKTEWEANKDLKNFAYDSSFVIFYPLPRYFWTNKLNTQAIERLHYGLQIAFDDGSMHEVWRKHYQQAVDFSKLNERRVFKLENPGLDGVVPGFEKYFYDPFK